MKVGSTKKKTKAAPAASKPSSRLAALISRINTKFGKGTAICASEAAGLEVRHLPTGAARLDIALGGGWPIGRIIEVFGPESSGKTTLMLSTITQFQRMFQEGVAVFIDLEKSYDPKYASRWGVDTDRLILINADSGEQGSDLIAEVANEELDMLVIVDSIAAMTPTAESEASMDANFVGAHPRLINRTMRVCTSRMKRSLADPSFPTTTAIFLNQVREKIGVMFGDPECLHGDTKINFVDGTSYPIREVVEQHITKPVWSFDERLNSFVPSQISAHCHKGVAKSGQLMTLTAKGVDTQNGVVSVTGTYTHKILTPKGWRKMIAIKVGDQVITRSRSVINSCVRSFLLGAYVGDTTFSGTAHKRAIKFQDAHNPEYVKWKVGLLSPHIRFSEYVSEKTGRSTFCSEERSDLARFFTETGGKRDPKLFFANPNNSLGLAVWIMDDGHLSREQMVLCVGRARHNAGLRQRISKGFADVGLFGQWAKDGKRFVFDKASTRILAGRIRSWVPPCMQYKLPEDMRGDNPVVVLDAQEHVVTVPTVVTSIGPASCRKYRDNRLYDLHVADSLTYQAGSNTNGIVVHNTTPGGKGKNFFASLRLRLFMSTSKKNRIVAKVKVSGIEKEEVVARRVSFNVVKNKCGGIPFEEGDFLFYLKKADGNEPWSFDNARALFEYGRYYRIITVDDDGAFTYTSSTDNITIAEKRERAFLDALRSEDNAALVGDLYTDIMAAVNRSCAGELVVDEAAESESDVDSGDESSED